MTDEPRPDTPETEGAATIAPPLTETIDAGAGIPIEDVTKEAAKLHQTVEIRDVGPCRKHIKVTVDRKDIDARLGEKFSELVVDSNVSGFRPGKAPRRIVERRFGKEVGDQVKTEVLLASLEQLAEENDVAPLAAPNIEPSKIELPKEGPLIYEFEVEVRPEFDLPNYKGLKIRRPVHTFTPDEIEAEERRLLVPYGQVVPKPEGNAQIGDIIVADVTTRIGPKIINSIKEATFRIDKQLAFKDGIAEKFGEQIAGASAGDTKQVDISLSTSVADPELRGKTVQATFEVKDVKKQLLPELTHEFLHTFGVHSPEQLRELSGVVLQRRLEYQQRQTAREQVMQHIAATANWQLPEDLLLRQARKAMSRRVMEMQADGISEQEIATRRRVLEQNILRSTELSLKEHFVLQKIAEVEKVDVSDDDMEDEIERLAAQNNENPRRLRARLERDDLLEALAAEMIERKALDLILDSAVYDDVPLGKEEQPPAVATSDEQAVPGEMRQPEAPAEGASGEETPN
jgi:trigger factor